MVINYSKEKGIVICDAHEDCTQQFVIDMINKACDFANEHNCKFILFDLRTCPDKMTLSERMNLTKTLFEQTALDDSFRNVVLKDGFANQRLAQFTELLAKLWGKDMFRIFFSEERALNWLQKQREKSLELQN